MCNSPDCRHPYECSLCSSECNEDEVDGCHECLPGRIEDSVEVLKELLKEAVYHQESGHRVHVWKRAIVGETDIVPELIKLFLTYYNPDFDEERERRRLRMVPR